MELLIYGRCTCGTPVYIVREIREHVPTGVIELEVKPCSVCKLAEYNKGFADGAIPSAVENKGEVNG